MTIQAHDHRHILVEPYRMHYQFIEIDAILLQHLFLVELKHATDLLFKAEILGPSGELVRRDELILQATDTASDGLWRIALRADIQLPQAFLDEPRLISAIKDDEMP